MTTDKVLPPSDIKINLDDYLKKIRPIHVPEMYTVTLVPCYDDPAPVTEKDQDEQVQEEKEGEKI